MLEVSGISVFYGKHRALDGVALNVNRGEIVVILGANGAGKTTLLNSVAGLVRAEPGARIAMTGRDLFGTPSHAIVEAGIALVPEGRGIFGELTVKENLLLGAYPARARASETANLEMVLGLFPRLQERLRQTVRTMSGGEQQMVAIGRALMSAPDVLLLDEPLANLDARLRVEMRREVRSLQRRLGITTIFVTHDQEEALELSDVVVVMREGRVEQVGPAEDVYARPGSPAVAEFLGGARVVVGEATEDGRLVVDGVALPLGLPADLAGKRVRVMFGGRRFSIVPD
jgi:branched-chain amino acid transport system ATP-binding protein